MGLFDIANGNADAPDKTHSDKSDVMVNANLGYGFEALGGKLTPSIDVTLNRVDDDTSQVDTEVKLVLTEAIRISIRAPRSGPRAFRWTVTASR